MTLQSFIDQWNGRPNNFDGAFGYQCVDLAKQYAHDFGLPIIKGNGIDWMRAPGYTWVDLGTSKPQPGDIMVFNSPPVTGHVSILVEDQGSHFISFDQNWPVGAYCQKVKHNYQNVIGWNKGAIVTQRDKDYEKMYVIFQVLALSAPPPANVEADLNHLEGIRLVLLSEGKTEAEADTLKWDQFFIERVRDYAGRYRSIGQRAGIL